MKIYIDITNLMNVSFLSGIQRVVIEVVTRILEDERFEIILVKHIPVKNRFQIIDNKLFLKYFRYNQGNKDDLLQNHFINGLEFARKSVFFDIDGVWNNEMMRSFMYPELKRRGIKIVVYVYDVIPITDRQFCFRRTFIKFVNYLGAVLQYADGIITSADATKKQLEDLMTETGVHNVPCQVSGLGGNFAVKDHGEVINQRVVRAAKQGPYILMVGTIEPRKNHSLVLDVLENQLADQKVNVIFAGRMGWNVEALEKRIKNHPMKGTRFFFFESPNDATVEFLYQNAFAVAFPTYNEGYGLPIVEAFQYNVPVIASDIPVLREVGQDYAVYFQLNDPADFADQVVSLLENESLYQQKKNRIREYRPVTWNDVTEIIKTFLLSYEQNTKRVNLSENNFALEQMVVLSARAKDLLRMLPFVENMMAFIKEVVICCPDRMVGEVKRNYEGRLKLEFLTDSEVLKDELLPEDHLKRNFYLRCKIMQNEKIQDNFIMSDDDYRPLIKMSQDIFWKDGRYQAYYFYDLKDWKGTHDHQTSYDMGQFRTKKFLEENGYPTLAFSSHQPQIICKKLYLEMLDAHENIELQGLDEWSTYFNYVSFYYPELIEVKPYVSMCWPAAKTDWDVAVSPREYLFENFYESLYENGNIFAGFSKEYHDGIVEENVQKVMIYNNEIKEQMIARGVFESNREHRRIRYKDITGIIIYKKKDDIFIHLPAYVQAKCDNVFRLNITFDQHLWEENIYRDFILKWNYINANKNVISSIQSVAIQDGDTEIQIPVRAGNNKGVYLLNIELDYKENGVLKKTGNVLVVENIKFEEC